ncbi:MAG: putative toxin-antitoxin system toxin component, PIN family [Phormidesmis priestleyi]|uniref:Putative toxin-antitoxin system toxin component, PIN family n=1 Tax=Phormidesmis priestleyi TaxID=268141 RepID=A0A2W4WLC9_9CYAN|nr:MAG: putative toxin-antitoxin system toxin component, PIN family [Phormidesmis priestleyi]
MTILRVVIDTNIWIRILLRGRMTLPILAAFNQGQFQIVMSQFLFDELHEVWQRPRLLKRIDRAQAVRLETQLKERSDWVEVITVPPSCRDAKDLPVLATAIDGKADIIVSGDDDLRADEVLRAAMTSRGIQLLGVNSFLSRLSEASERKR